LSNQTLAIGGVTVVVSELGLASLWVRRIPMRKAGLVRRMCDQEFIMGMF